MLSLRARLFPNTDTADANFFYPYKLARRANLRGPRLRPGPQIAPPPPTREEGEAAAVRERGGAKGLLRSAARANYTGLHKKAFKAAALAAVAAPTDAAVCAGARAAQASALDHSLRSFWAQCVRTAAQREQQRIDEVAAAAARRAAKRESSTPKPRQGYAKPLLRALHVRMCCACRKLAPRELMARVVRLIPLPPTASPNDKPRPLRRRRKVFGHWIPVPPPEPYDPTILSTWLGPKVAIQRPDPSLEASLAPETASTLFADQFVWVDRTNRGRRSAYVCLRPSCAVASIRRKALARGLILSTVPPDIGDALLEFAKAVADAPPRCDERWGELMRAMPEREELPPAKLVGPHDKWDNPPSGPK